MSTIVETRALSKRYGQLAAVKDLSLKVEEGELFGFIGPNGAGKTSTIRMLTTLLRPSGGDAWVAGHSVQNDPRSVRALIGYMPDFFGVYDDMRVWEYLDFFAGCYRIPERQRGPLIDDLLQLVELGHRREDMADELSRGMKQRLSLARTLIHDPQVLILDEPASGLDPRARVEIRELLVELSRMGKTIFFSTQILSDVAEICTSICIIEAGQMVAVGTLDDLRKQIAGTRRVEITISSRAEEVLAYLQSMESVSEARIAEDSKSLNRIRIELKFTGTDQSMSDLITALTQRGFQLVNFSETGHDLDEVFMHMTKGLVT